LEEITNNRNTVRNRTPSFSIIGRTFEADFGEKTFTLLYEDNDTLILTETKGPETGRTQRLHVSIVELRQNLFMVNWQEDTKLTNTDIEDYENGTVYANMTTPSDNLVTAKGKLREIKAQKP
jgi:hypothetical protein